MENLFLESKEGKVSGWTSSCFAQWDYRMRTLEKKSFQQLVDSLNMVFVGKSLKAADEYNAMKMRELVQKGRGMKREAE